jgi:dTDP-4-amino-4,6-dideoxygalactose transaminase
MVSSQLDDQNLTSVLTYPRARSTKFHHVYNQFTIRSPFRDELRESVRQAGIPSEIYYPLCLHLQKAFIHLGYAPGDFPVAEAATMEVLSRPVFPELLPALQDLVVKAVESFCASKNPSG